MDERTDLFDHDFARILKLAIPNETSIATIGDSVHEVIRAILERYGQYANLFEPMLEASSASDRAKAASHMYFDDCDADVAKSELQNTIECRTRMLTARRKLIELQPSLVEPAAQLDALLQKLREIIDTAKQSIDDATDLSALAKECEQLQNALTRAISHATKSIEPVPRLSQRSNKASKRADQLPALILSAVQAHASMKAAKKGLSWPLNQGKSNGPKIEDPSKPSAEEVIQFIDRWFARVTEELAFDRNTYFWFVEYHRAANNRKRSMSQIREMLYQLEKATLAEDRQLAIIGTARSAYDRLRQAEYEIELDKRYYRLDMLEPALDHAIGSVREKELANTLNEQIEMVAYAVGARNLAESELKHAERERQPQPPEPDADDPDCMLNFQSALQRFILETERHKEKIRRKKSILEGRILQLSVLATKLQRIREQCSRLNKMSDELLVPYTVAGNFVRRFAPYEDLW